MQPMPRLIKAVPVARGDPRFYFYFDILLFLIQKRHVFISYSLIREHNWIFPQTVPFEAADRRWSNKARSDSYKSYKAEHYFKGLFCPISLKKSPQTSACQTNSKTSFGEQNESLSTKKQRPLLLCAFIPTCSQLPWVWLKPYGVSSDV